MGAGDHCLQPDPPVSLQRQALKPSPPIGPVRCFSTNSNLHSARLSSHNFPPVPTSARPPLFTQTRQGAEARHTTQAREIRIQISPRGSGVGPPLPDESV